MRRTTSPDDLFDDPAAPDPEDFEPGFDDSDLDDSLEEVELDDSDEDDSDIPFPERQVLSIAEAA